MYSIRKTIPVIFGILILTSISGFQLVPITIQTAEAEPSKQLEVKETSRDDLILIIVVAIAHSIKYNYCSATEQFLEDKKIEGFRLGSLNFNNAYQKARVE